MKQNLLFVFALVASALLQSSAHASTFDVLPIMITLTPKTASQMVAVTNRSPEALRFTVSVMAWSQSPSGEMVLTPTKDVVFFPSMLTLNPGEARNIRVGASVPPDASEKTYRLFVQELPAMSRPGDTGEIRMLTKMGLPVFVQGAQVKPVPAIASFSFKDQKAKFVIKNTGNAHFIPQKITLSARDEKGKVIHAQEVKGWYLLAGGQREFEVSVPVELCGTMRSLELSLKLDAGGVSSAKLGNVVCTR